jgi:preprotein translocase subunit SecA
MQASPSVLWHTLDQGVSEKPILTGLDAGCHAGLGELDRLASRRLRFLRQAKHVLRLDKFYKDISNTCLHEEVEALRCLFRRHRDTTKDLERAFAVIREIAFRQIGEKPYLVQVMGAFALTHGCIAEMGTGEGKTLTATLPATIAGWRGLGCHVITVNDYLAKRDAQWMGDIYRFCGVNAAYVEQGMPPNHRRQAYLADITYCTNKEVSADFLRDKIALGAIKNSDTALLSRFQPDANVLDRVVQRGLNYAIVDEADSVLIDESVTPLIISGPAPNKEQLDACARASSLAELLQPDQDYRVNARHREIKLTAQGRETLSHHADSGHGIWKATRRREELITKALTAREFYQKDKHYVVQDDKVVIVDDFTGRLMTDRSWRDGLHQAVEAKEGLELTPIKDTYARISFQRFFRLYRTLSGMTGTALEARREFWSVYHLPVVVIPPNKRCQRKQYSDIVMRDQAHKWAAIVTDVKHTHNQGRPVLIGTRSVHASELLSRMLTAEQLDHQVLNAVRHQEESQIVAMAGQAGRITVATNMAGRGTDIKLGPGIADLGGLHVISAEKNESNRIDRQLFGRCARQGDPGSTRVIVSLEDDLINRHAARQTRMARKLSLRFGANQSSPVTRSVFSNAQKRTQRLARQQRKSVMKTDRWLEDQLGFAPSY